MKFLRSFFLCLTALCAAHSVLDAASWLQWPHTYWRNNLSNYLNQWNALAAAELLDLGYFAYQFKDPRMKVLMALSSSLPLYYL